MRLFLVRHGQIHANKAGLWHGSTDSPLTWKGKRQARKTGRWFKPRVAFDAVYTSPLQRCHNTANHILRSQNAPPIPTLVPGLAEMSIGDWEGIAFRDLAEEYGFFAKIEDDPGFVAPNGESLTSVGERVADSLQKIMADHTKGQDILVVSHGVALGAGLSVLFDNHVKSWRNFRLANCSITELENDEKLVLSRVNQTLHL